MQPVVRSRKISSGSDASTSDRPLATAGALEVLGFVPDLPVLGLGVLGLPEQVGRERGGGWRGGGCSGLSWDDSDEVGP
jgi:hypothetical protein